jgi:hypothetical protein
LELQDCLLRLLDELRPLTLLNCDYRILSKFLVKRMKPVLPFVIKSGQLCTVGKKNILFGVNNILSSVLYVKEKNVGACLLSLDFFNAYDRVLVDFLLVVMKKMNFSKKFCNWIRMLHAGARTRFILKNLTRSVRVSFSIRQGDPLSMLLYIVYIEPLLIYIEGRIAGLSIPNIQPSLDAYCDDVNVVTETIADLVVVNEAVKKFESLSGAILSRNKKCKIIGFGSWKNRVDWPLQYVTTVKEIKVFGVFIMDSYQELVKRNWSFRFSKFEQSILSWSSRALETIFQRDQNFCFVQNILLGINSAITTGYSKEYRKIDWEIYMGIFREDIEGCVGRNEESIGERGLWFDLHQEHVQVFIFESSFEAIEKWG